MFDDPGKLFLGLVTGIIFGVLLQKGQVAKFQVIMGQLLLKNFTVLKIMATAIVVGAVGVNAIIALGGASLHVKEASMSRVVVGGILFGIGMAVFGLCPGTSVAASGEGRRDAMVGVVGMLFGAASYVVFFPALQDLFAIGPNWGKTTLPQATGGPMWVWVVAVAILLGTVLAVVQKLDPDNREPRS